MAERILVAVAWPYSNGPLHVGHIAGVYLPADIFARYQRLKGREVLMVSGSDCHGTPITLRAEQEGITPQEIIKRYHRSFLKTFKTLGISFDLFTQTYTDNHYRVTTDFFNRLNARGYLYKDKMVSSYSETLGRFLPDRFVEGACPNCGFEHARGDQCDSCGRLHDPWELIAPRSKMDGSPVVFRETEHFFFDLAQLGDRLEEWLNSGDRSYWRPNTIKFTNNWLREGLRGRAITRDIDWGVPVPVDHPLFDEKRIYVWFDAVIGYLSASIEWATLTGKPERWRDWWDIDSPKGSTVRSYYFIGKDNIPFHTIIWPAMLLGHGRLNLPYDVPASEFMNLEGRQMSTGRNWAVWLPDIEDRYHPDQIRYYLTANAPESQDSNWSWADFVRRNNDELVATWGNLANRVLTIAYRNFGVVPEPGHLTEGDLELLTEAEDYLIKVGGLIEAVHQKAALQEAMSLAQRTNQYISEQRPWNLVNDRPERAGGIIYTALRVIDCLKLLLAPFLPVSCQRLHHLLGYDDEILPPLTIKEMGDVHSDNRPVLTYSHVKDRVDRWKPSRLIPGQKLREPENLFQKLQSNVIAEELERLTTTHERL